MRKACQDKGLKQVKLGKARENLNIDCLTFAVDLALLTEDIETAEQKLNKLNLAVPTWNGKKGRLTNFHRKSRVYDEY